MIFFVLLFAIMSAICVIKLTEIARRRHPRTDDILMYFALGMMFITLATWVALKYGTDLPANK